MDIRDKITKILYKNSLGFTILKTSITVNIINICNRKCSFCPYHSPNIVDNYHTHWFKAQPDILSFSDFSLFLKQLIFFKKWIKHISITGKGEPTLHPDFCGFCDLLEDHKIPFSVTSNGSDQNIEYVLNYKYLTGLRISIYDKKTWGFWKEIKSPKLGFYNMTGIHIDKIEDGFISAQYGIRHKRAIKDFNKETFCKTPFYFLTINTDGSVVPCYSYHKIGSICDNFLTLWNGKKIREYRKQAVNGRYMEFADCDNCGINIVSNYEKD